MDWMQALFLGLVQGLTEFLPISSTAHLRVVPHWLGWEDPGAEFSAVIQLGTLLAVLVYFWKDVQQLVVAVLVGLKNRKPFETAEAQLAWSIAAGTLPIGILGLGFKDWIKTEARALWIIGTALIVLARGSTRHQNQCACLLASEGEGRRGRSPPMAESIFLQNHANAVIWA